MSGFCNKTHHSYIEAQTETELLKLGQVVDIVLFGTFTESYVEQIVQCNKIPTRSYALILRNKSEYNYKYDEEFLTRQRAISYNKITSPRIAL